MNAPDEAALREQLRAALEAAGLEATDERVERLLPQYRGMRSGSARLATLDLGETEPAIVFRVPSETP
jgi:hypothetical protein